MNFRFRPPLVPLVAALLAGGALAHDQEPSSLEVDVSPDRSARVTFVIQLAPTMRRVLSPELSLGDFATRYTTLPEPALAAAYKALQDSFALQVRLVADSTKVLKLSDIAWPPASTVRQAIQEMLPAALYETDQAEICYRMWTIKARAKLPPKTRRLEARMPRGFERLPPSVEWPEEEKYPGRP